MHSFVFEFSKEPIPVDDRLTEYDIPEWFIGAVADSWETVSQPERDIVVQNLVDPFGDTCRFDGETITFLDGAKDLYFRQSFEDFRKNIGRLGQVPFDAFAGKEDPEELRDIMYRLKKLYDDIYGTYIFDRDDCSMVTMDRWMRDMTPGEKLYNGGVVDYLC